MKRLELKQIKKTFQSGEVEEEVLKGINLSLKEGEWTALTGASGSGKSTLLTIAAGLQPATAGEVIFDGKVLDSNNKKAMRQARAEAFGFIFQPSHLVPFLTVEEQLAMMLDVSGWTAYKREKKQRIREALDKVAMTHRTNAYPSSLSGGEKQRVAVARAIIHDPKVLFADEPTASLDSKRSIEIMELIQDVTQSSRTTTLMITHEEELLSYVDRTVKMSDGRITTS
ncbi:UNVERIFIED_CONTAM: ABC transporter ATP-binding protein [Halobacillus marinus]